MLCSWRSINSGGSIEAAKYQARRQQAAAKGKAAAAKLVCKIIMAYQRHRVKQQWHGGISMAALLT